MAQQRPTIRRIFEGFKIFWRKEAVIENEGMKLKLIGGEEMEMKFFFYFINNQYNLSLCTWFLTVITLSLSTFKDFNGACNLIRMINISV